MRAKVEKGFPGRPDGSRDVKNFQPGDVVSGELAEVAIREKWATPLPDSDEAAAPPPRRRRTDPKAPEDGAT